MVIYFIFLFILPLIYGAGLSKTQLRYIADILNNPITPIEIKQKTKGILVHYHDKWLHKQVHDFAKKNRFSSEFKKELYESAKIGLFKSLRKYNASMPLYTYAEKYIFYEFTISITKQKPLGYLSHYYRYIKKVNISEPIFAGDENEFLYNQIPEKKEENKLLFYMNDDNNVYEFYQERKKIHKLIEKLSPQEKRMFYYRYDNETLDVIRSIAHVCELCGIHYETFRPKMRKVMNYLKENLSSL